MQTSARRPRVLKRFVRAAAATLLMAACAGTSDLPGAAGEPLDESLFPMLAATRRFATDRGGSLVVTTEPMDQGVALRLGGGGTRLDVTRTTSGISFSGGPQATTELIRTGATPGATWTSGDASVRFDGWERITVPAGTFDAARIRSTTGPESLRVVETWWFARGTGLVRLRADRGGIFADEMSLASTD